MCRTAGIFLLQRLKGRISRDAHDFNNMEPRAVIEFLLLIIIIFFLQDKAPKEIHAIQTIIRGKCNIVCHRQNWLAQFKSDDFSTCDAPRPGRPKTVTTPEIIDQIHDLI